VLVGECRCPQRREPGAAAVVRLRGERFHQRHQRLEVLQPALERVAIPLDQLLTARDLDRELRIGGRLVIPVGPTAGSQQLLRVTRVADREFTEEALLEVVFVPLIGEEGFKESARPEDGGSRGPFDRER